VEWLKDVGPKFKPQYRKKKKKNHHTHKKTPTQKHNCHLRKAPRTSGHILNLPSVIENPLVLFLLTQAYVYMYVMYKERKINCLPDGKEARGKLSLVAISAFNKWALKFFSLTVRFHCVVLPLQSLVWLGLQVDQLHMA
jgi:hypothetical protein